MSAQLSLPSVFSASSRKDDSGNEPASLSPLFSSPRESLSESQSNSSQRGADTASVVSQLRSSIRQLQDAQFSALDEDGPEVVSTGVVKLDEALPRGGIVRGGLAEWVGIGEGSGATTLAMIAARNAQTGGPVVVIDWPQMFYPLAAELMGIELANVVVVRPSGRTEMLWALEQCLRCSGLGAVFCRVGHLTTQESRRLQLAAEQGTAVGLLVRPESARKRSSWADMRFVVGGSCDFGGFCRPDQAQRSSGTPNRLATRLPEQRCAQSGLQESLFSATEWRHGVAPGVSPGNATTTQTDKPRRGDMNNNAINSCRPSGARFVDHSRIPGLTPGATPCRHSVAEDVGAMAENTRPMTETSALALSRTKRFIRRIRIEMTYVKGGSLKLNQAFQLELCDETGAVCVAAEVSAATSAG